MWVLDQYYSDFPVYNPALLNLPKSILSKKMSGFKVYSLEGETLVYLLRESITITVNMSRFLRACLIA